MSMSMGRPPCIICFPNKAEDINMGFLDALFKPLAQSDEDAERSAIVMRRLKSRHDTETGKWLALMDDPTNQAPPSKVPAPRLASIDKREVLNEAPYVPPMEAQYLAPELSAPSSTAQAVVEGNQTVDWVNTLFSEFERQSKKFNASAEGTHLIMTVHRPTFTFETSSTIDKHDPYKKVSVFKGHVSTVNWAMLVQGYESKIRVYIISSDEILNFTINDIRQSQIIPFMEITSSMVDGRRVFNFGETKICSQAIPRLAKELLGDLVRVSAGTMSEDELYVDGKVDLKLGETVARGFPALKPPETVPVPEVSAKKSGKTTSAHPLQPKEKTPEELIKGLSTWPACTALIEAMNKDISALASRKSNLDPENEKDKEALEQLQEIAGALRTLSGQVSEVVAEYHPSKGSKYNPS